MVVLHETIHELHREKLDGVLFKIDFEKAYDKVKWSFLQQTLRMKGFSAQWCEWVARFVQGGVSESELAMTSVIIFKHSKGYNKGIRCPRYFLT